MPSDKDLLKKRKETLLTELESIKGLLESEHTDNIPLLQDAIIEEKADFFDDIYPPNIDDEKTNDFTHIEDYEFSFDDKKEPQTPPSTNNINNSTLADQASLFNDTPPTYKNEQKPQKTAGSHASLSQNPFLPPHVRQRFEKASQETRTETQNSTTKSSAQGAVVNASYTERLVDQLVAHHLPKIEAELRKKLLAVVKLHNERLKK